jgi:hypothetical protein
MDDPYATSFIDPVDITQYPDYLWVVHEPMCLKKVKDRLEAGRTYTKTPQDFKKDQTKKRSRVS